MKLYEFVLETSSEG